MNNNILQFLKDGGIHIKKKNKGLFTNYCNGKVTQACINRGKHSSNPITRKRATFADNVRHWVKKGQNGLAIQQEDLIRYSYGYPVYWSNSVPDKYKWVSTYLQEHPDVTGMAIGGGAQGKDDQGQRIIVRNSYSNIISDRNDSRWEGLDKIEAIRHFMNEINYNPKFKISQQQEKFRKDNFDKSATYNTNNNAWKQSIISRILTGDMEGTPEQIEESNKFMQDFNKRLGKFQQGGSFDLIEYIKAIENPNKIGWNGKAWVAPPEGKGYDPNQRGYGIDVEYNVAAKKLTEGRPGRYITDQENDSLMKQHLDYVRNVANRKIDGFNKLSPTRQGVILGMLYRGDSVKDINIKEPNDYKFFDQVHDYYRKVGVGERAKLSSEYLANLKRIHAPKIISTLNSDKTQVIKPTYFPIDNKNARYPTKKGSYVQTMSKEENFIENLKEKIRIKNLMEKLKPRIPEPYKFKILKEGGIIKASLGTTFGKINNFLGSDAGKSIINGITTIGSTIKSNKQLGDSAELAKSGIDFETKQKKAQAHNYGYNRALDYIRNIQDPNNPNAFGGDIFQNHFANQMANQFTQGFDEEAEAKKLQIDQQVKQQQVDTMSGAINSFADTGMNMLQNLLNKPKFDNSKNNYSVSNSGNKSTITTNIGGISTTNTYNIPKANLPTFKFKSNLV